MSFDVTQALTAAAAVAGRAPSIRQRAELARWVGGVRAGGTGVPATSIPTENRRRPSRPATSGSVARCRRVPGTTSPRLVSYVGHPYLVFRLGVAAADRPVDRTPRLPIEQAMEVRS